MERGDPALSGCVTELDAVDGPRVAVAAVGSLDIGDPVLYEPGKNLGAQPLLGVVHAGLLGLKEVGHDLLQLMVRLVFVEMAFWATRHIAARASSSVATRMLTSIVSQTAS